MRARLRWAAPQLVTAGSVAPRGDLLLWVDEYRRFPTLRATQAGRVLAQRRTPWPAAPGRVFRVPWSLVSGADPSAGEIVVELV